MKKFILLIICIAILALFSGCTSITLPKGNASRIDFVDGWSIGESTFEYVNENTIKIIRISDEQVFYVPNNSVDMIWVK